MSCRAGPAAYSSFIISTVSGKGKGGLPLKIAFYTLGCKVNQYETQALEQLLAERGHTIVPFTQAADA